MSTIHDTSKKPEFKQTENPFFPKITEKEIESLVWAHGLDAAEDLLYRREQMLWNANHDPLNFGFELRPWEKGRELLAAADELLILGGNRASKTEFAAKMVCETLANKPKAVAWCLHSSLPTSIELQQPIIKKYLPPEWREMGKKGAVANVSWTDKNGFSDQVFVLPNKSRCRFLHYTQDIKVLEGGECDIIWCDELVPLNWLETLRFRIATRQGKLIITFTPVKGYSMTVKDYVAGSKITETRPSELLPNNINVPGCPPGTMPYVMEPFRKNSRVMTFFTEDNPFGGYESVKKMLEGKSTTEIKIRAYGWADKLEGKIFAKFDEDVHVAAPDKIPTKGTRFCSTDPAGVKNWFIKWYIIDTLGRAFIYREWPDRGTYGEWALPSEKPDGRAGPAQFSDHGNSIIGYKKLILELEGWKWNERDKEWDGSGAEKIFCRYIDPRMGGAEVPSEQEGTSIISMMQNPQQDKHGNVIGPQMTWLAADGGSIDEGIQVINNWLDYNEGEEVSVLNAPRLYVSSDCEQSIYAFHEYTGRDGLKGALKDVVDPDRYFLKSGPEYINENQPLTAGGGSY